MYSNENTETYKTVYLYLDVLALCGLHFLCTVSLSLSMCSRLMIIFDVCAVEITPFCGFITIIVIGSLSLSFSYSLLANCI